MKEILKNNKLMYVILLLVAFIVSTSVTYAFFSLTVTGNENAKLSYPIGLLTADEVAYAGVPYGLMSISFYLYTSEDNWLISPAGWSADDGYAYSFHVNSDGSLNSYNVDHNNGALPAVSLRPEVTVSSTGDGSYTNPYVVVN